MLRHCRNFGVQADEIIELSTFLQMATQLNVQVHVNSDERAPDVWELEFIRNVGAHTGSGSCVLRMLTAAADLHEKAVIGFAQNMVDCRMPPERKLMAWYERHGFAAGCKELHGVQIKREAVV